MKKLINLIKKEINNITCKISFESNKLNTIVYNTSNLYINELKNFSKAFNLLFNSKCENILETYIIHNDLIFHEAIKELNSGNLFETSAIIDFNNATFNTSKCKCSGDYNYYIMKCYEYFIYIFDKKNKKCFMIVKNNKKVITMINILILTPYLLYGELFAIHGGLVNKDKKNVLINNSSLGGKTTFAILFASNGWDIITEETTYISNSGVILPYNIRNYFNIRVGTYLNFLDYFKSKNIIINEFIKMKNKSSNDLFDYGKKSQVSIDFERIGKFKILNPKYITTSLKVSIDKNQNFELVKCSPLENVNSFLELSLAPTVLLFKELLNFDDINVMTRKKQLESIFNKTCSFKLMSGFDYKENFNEIIKNIY